MKCIWDLGEENPKKTTECYYNENGNQTRQIQYDVLENETYRYEYSYYENGNPDRAITWFKDSEEGNEIFSQMTFYLKMAEKYHLDLYRSEAEEIPGELVYEDAFQIAVKNCREENIKTVRL